MFRPDDCLARIIKVWVAIALSKVVVKLVDKLFQTRLPGHEKEVKQSTSSTCQWFYLCKLFTLCHTGGDSDHQFDVNSTTGEIFTRKPLVGDMLNFKSVPNL